MPTERPPAHRQFHFDLKPTPIVLRLMIINIGLWFLTASAINFFGAHSLGRTLYDYFMVSPGGVTESFYVWQPFTYMWLHDTGGFGHIFFNMLGLFFLGPPLERRWGRRTFLKFYVLAGVIAGVFSVLMGLLIPAWFGSPTLGASGSILAILAAFSLVMPNAEILLFFIIPIKARLIIWLALGVDVLMFLASDPTSNRIGIHTHFGGALAAWLLITGNWRPRVAMQRLRAWSSRRRPPRGPTGGGRKGRSGFRVIQGGRDDDPTLH